MAGKQATPADVRLGARLRAARVGAGQTQREAATVLGISAAQWQKYEKGTNRISATDLRLFCGLVRQPIGAFFDQLGPAAEARDLSAAEAREALCAAAEAYFQAKAREGDLPGASVVAFLAEAA